LKLGFSYSCNQRKRKGNKSFDFLESLLLELYESWGYGVLFWCEEEGRMSSKMPLEKAKEATELF
jgi:hypothetical protein